MSEEVKAYQKFIDELVEYRDAPSAGRFRSGVWHPEPPPGQIKYQELLGRLSEKDRMLIAELLQEAADGGIHMTLRTLTDGEYHLSQEGTKLPWEPYGTEMYFDFVARVAGDPWPQESSP